MKALKYFLYLFIISLVITSCDERDYDMPPIKLPQYTGDPANIDIKQLKERFNQATATLVAEDIIFEARVVGNDESGNIFKQMVLQDSTGYGIILSIDVTGTFANFPVGEKVFVNLNGLHIGKYGNEHQIGTLYNGSIGRMDENQFETHVFADGLPMSMAPKLVKIADLVQNSDSYVNSLIRIDDVKFLRGGETVFAENTTSAPNAAEVQITDLNNGNLGVRTSKYANFAMDSLPVGYGSLVGVLGRFNGAWQFTLRSRHDVINFQNLKGTKTNPFTVTEAIAKGIDESSAWWTKGYIVGSAAVGYGESNPITGSNGFIFNEPFLKNSIVIAEKPGETDWTKYMVIQLPSGAAIEAINLENTPGNKGKAIIIKGALKKVFGTHGIQTVGTAGDYVFESSVVEPVPTGDGTKENPYNYYRAITKQGEAGKWVKAYIVGSVSDKILQSEAQFVGPFINAANILIAATPTETNPSNCFPVQLPGGDVRTQLNLVANPGNLGKEVMVYGNLIAYFGAPGMKETSDYVLDGSSGPDPIIPGDAIFSATFATDFDGFTPVSVVGTDTWLHDAANKYVKMTGFVGGVNNANESWLISPAIDLTGKTSATLKFDHTGRMFDGKPTMKDDLTVWVSSDYVSGMPSTATWTPVVIPTYMTGDDWLFVSSGDISLSSLLNKPNARIAFKFISTNTYSGNWEIKNVAIK